jgi:hypothetical protein
MNNKNGFKLFSHMVEYVVGSPPGAIRLVIHFSKPYFGLSQHFGAPLV